MDKKTTRIKSSTHFKVDGFRRKIKAKTFEEALEILIQMGFKHYQNKSKA